MIKNKKIFNSCFKAGGVLFCIFAAVFFTVFGASLASAQTAMVTEVNVQYPADALIDFHNSSKYMCTDWNQANSTFRYRTSEADKFQDFPNLNSDTAYTLSPDIDFVNFWSSESNYTLGSLFYNAYTSTKSSDPWRNSALIEFDQPYMRGRSSNTLWLDPTTGYHNYINPLKPTTGHASGDGSFAYYPNHCLHLCATVTCANPARKTTGAGTGTNSNEVVYEVSSSDFPIQSVLFEVFKYQPNSNPYNADTTPPIRTIALTPAGSTSANTCYGVGVCTKIGTSIDYQSCCDRCNWYNPDVDPGCPDGFDGNCASTCKNFRNKAECEAGTLTLKFCAGWDGSYEIDGEFGKSNGQFGFRANVKTKWPGDGISSGGDVEVDHTMAYPGVASEWPDRYAAQIPIQVDVTNVHSVRSSSTMVGTTTKVPAQPYNLTYKLSKDATTTIKIIDPDDRKCTCPSVLETEGSAFAAYQCTATGGGPTTFAKIDFNVIDGKPRLGEGVPDGKQTNLDAWDGRDDRGNLLPYGNYLVSIQASTYDEWTEEGQPDISRAVTRQLSLDPLKITDIKETGLAKLSTSYAKIDYVLTEAASVHVMIFTPGTYFKNVDMERMAAPAGTILSRIANNSGTWVDHITEQKQARVNVNTKWDGICRNPKGCNINGNPYQVNTPMPDGDYVYVMWAEIPYSFADGVFANGDLTISSTAYAKSAICVNGKWWTGVRTYKYHNGILPINRGLPEITVGTVGYSTLGSSPTAFGLDPFIFNYAVSRDSIVDATIKTTANEGETPKTVKKLLTNEVAVSAKQNTFSWDGVDDKGYQVSPGTYMVEFVAKDSLYPEKQSTMTAQFPVDLFRVVDVNTTPLLDEATAQATISYTLSKSMDTVVEIYDQGVVIPTNDCAPGQQYSTTTTHSSTTAAQCWCQYASTSTTSDNWYLLPATDDPTKLLKVFTLPKAGEGVSITEVWDGLKQSSGSQGVKPVSDGNYPYRICTRTTQDIAHYYNTNNDNPQAQNPYDTAGQPEADKVYKDGASDKPSGFVTIARGSIAFNKVAISPSQPVMKYSSETIYLPAYEVAFSTSRSSSVQIEVISTDTNQCLGTTPAGTVCRTLSTYAYNGTDGYFDPTKIYKVYWDGKDSKGQYVKYGSYEIKLTGLPYPMPDSTPNPMLPGTDGGKPLATIFSQVISVNNFQVYDRYVEDITRENPNGKFAYQISVPMKVAIQILKPGTMSDRTTNAGNAIGLIDPITGQKVTNINDVLVKSIVGIRPNLVSLDEVWDGTDYAGQEVPDGIYPYRYVTTLNAYDMDSVTGAINNVTDLDQAGAKVADWEKYITLEHINVAKGDSWFADVDWKSSKVTSFFPNPLNEDKGWFEIAKLPAPGYLTIKIYNIAGDLVRDKGFQCVNAQGVVQSLDTINAQGGLQPYMLGDTTQSVNTVGGRNFTLRCEWNKENNYGKKVARGLYYAIMELDPTRGNAKNSQRVIKILIP